MPTVRTFIAIELTPEILAMLDEIQERLRHGEGGRAGRWVRKEGIHLTLKFLGEVPSERLEEIAAAARRACAGVRPFVLTMAGLDCFPNLRRPRVVWVGVREEGGQLAALQRAVEREFVPLGFPTEERGFTPHLTLARTRNDATPAEIQALGKAVAEQKIDEVAKLRADALSVMKSELRRDGAVYTELYRVNLESVTS